MTRLAHLSDLHLLERSYAKRRGLAKQRLAFLSAGAPLDPEQRIRTAIFALQHALRLGAEHIVVTGDLTEDGDPAQFEVLAEVLDRSGVDPERTTLVPGNHDAYSQRDALAAALDGPLRAFKPSSTAACILPGAVVLPISTVAEGQWFTRSGGQIRCDDVIAVRRWASRPDFRGHAIVVAQHHPLGHRALPPFDWFDRVQNAAPMRDLVLERTRVHVLHGHVHRAQTKRFCGREHAQIYAAASVRDTDQPMQAVRLYEAEAGTLREAVVTAPILQPLPAAANPRPAILPPVAAFS